MYFCGIIQWNTDTLFVLLFQIYRRTDSLGWKLIVNSNTSNTTKINYLKLTFRPQLEAFIRRSWYSVLPVLDTTERCRVKKAVVGVTELIAALVPIHSVLAFLADMYCLFDPPGKSHRLPVDNTIFFPAQVFCRHMLLILPVDK